MTIDDAAGSGQDVSNDTLSLDFATPRNTQDATGLDKSAMERLQLLADYSATFSGVFNPAADKSHDVFKDVGTTDVTRTCSQAVSGQTLAVEALLTDYIVARADTGELTWQVPAVLQSGTAPSWA